MRTIFIQNGVKRITPYWKWLAHEFRKLEEAPMYVPLLEELVSVSAAERQVEIVLKICGDIHRTMKDKNIITDESDKHPLPLFHAHLELLAKGKI